MLEHLDHQGFVSRNPAQTQAFGARLGEDMAAGDVLLLNGEFGAGKTTLVQGIARGLEITDLVNSPSFTLINEYQGRLPVYHVDLFRLERLDLEMEQAIENCIQGEGVTVIEWPGLVPPDLKEGALNIDLSVLGEDDRSIVVHLQGTRWRPARLAEVIEEVIGDGGPGTAER